MVSIGERIDYYGRRYSTPGKALVLHAVDPALVPSIPYGPPSPPGVIMYAKSRVNTEPSLGAGSWTWTQPLDTSTLQFSWN